MLKPCVVGGLSGRQAKRPSGIRNIERAWINPDPIGRIAINHIGSEHWEPIVTEAVTQFQSAGRVMNYESLLGASQSRLVQFLAIDLSGARLQCAKQEASLTSGGIEHDRAMIKLSHQIDENVGRTRLHESITPRQKPLERLSNLRAIELKHEADEPIGSVRREIKHGLENTGITGGVDFRLVHQG